MTIEWKSITDGYNDKYGTDYTEKQMWKAEYPKHTGKELDKMFMVNHMTILERIRYHGITIEPKGHRRPTRLEKFQAIPQHHRDRLSVTEIAELIGACVGTVRYYKVRYGR